MMNALERMKKFHQAKWNEPIIYEISEPGQRAVVLPGACCDCVSIDEAKSTLPEGMLRTDKANLPELAQLQLVRHYNHLSQENIGIDGNIDIGQGTCTMKYNPKVNDRLAGLAKVTDMHPLQPIKTAQGVLEVYYRLTQLFKAITGLDAVSVQGGGGSHGVLALASAVRAYWRDKGEEEKRDEIITTLFSHPVDAAVPIFKGYKAIIIQPDADGYPDIEAFKAALSDRTAAIFFTNPEDTGIFNVRIKEFTKLAHEKGVICCYDQANANGLLGITRTAEADFDMSFFNLHKTFSSPHGCGGPGSALVAAKAELRPYLPKPLVEYSPEKGYYLDFDMPKSCGKIKSFWGVIPAIIRAYSWIMMLGAEGLSEVSRVAILNNNYCMKKILAIKGASLSFPHHPSRIEQARYSWQKMKEETGFGTADVQRVIPDFGTHYWSSHEPWVVPEPFTIEPSESYSKTDIDDFVAVLEEISRMCYEEPEAVKHAPSNSTVHHIDHDYFDDPKKYAITWRAYNKKYNGYFEHK